MATFSFEFFRVEADYGIFQRCSGAAVEEVAFDLGSVFAGDGDVAAVVEGFFEGLAEFFFGGEGGDPAFEFSCSTAGSDFERVGILHVRRMLFVCGRLLCLSYFFSNSKSFTTEGTEEHRGKPQI